MRSLTSSAEARNCMDLNAGPQVFSLMTSFTHCYHDILYTSARAERGRQYNPSPLRSGQDGMGDKGSATAAGRVCGSGTGGGADGRVVPRVPDLAPYGLFMAAAL